MTIQYGTATRSSDLEQILALQQANLPHAVSPADITTQGFVTATHDLPLLTEMNQPYPHVVARDDRQVIGYALVMRRTFAPRIPVLVPMFDQINAITYRGELLGEVNYFVMGQICVARVYRGKGVFRGLYDTLRRHMQPHFPYVVTEVSKRNQRSMRAHARVGFANIHEYASPLDGEEWVLLLWDWT